MGLPWRSSSISLPLFSYVITHGFIPFGSDSGLCMMTENWDASALLSSVRSEAGEISIPALRRPSISPYSFARNGDVKSLSPN